MNLNRNFEVKQIEDKKVLGIYLYGEICSDYYDWFTAKIVESTTSANYVRKAIDEAGEVDEIKVYINSCGGSVSEGNAIFNILKRANAVITVYVDAFAYSIASVIAMAGDRVIMPSNTTMMIHNAIMFDVWGNSAELRKCADDLDKINEASCNSYLIKAGDKLTPEKLKELLDNETFLTAEDAYAYGLCDEIINPVESKESESVIKQALDCKNPVARKAIEQIRRQQKNADPKPNKASEPKQKNNAEWLEAIIKNEKLFKGVFK